MGTIFVIGGCVVICTVAVGSKDAVTVDVMLGYVLVIDKLYGRCKAMDSVQENDSAQALTRIIFFEKTPSRSEWSSMVDRSGRSDKRNKT